MNIEKLEVPFDESITLHRFNSFKNPDTYCFGGKEVVELLKYKNLTKAIHDTNLVLGEDYMILEKSNCPMDIWKLFEFYKIVTKQTPRTTIIYEIGFWKLSLLRTTVNNKLLDWICKEVIPSIRELGYYKNENLIVGDISTYILYDSSNKIYKIGKTTDLKNRLVTLKTSNLKVQYIKTIEGDYEKYLHSYFKDKHIELEWYNLTENDINNIDEIIKLY